MHLSINDVLEIKAMLRRGDSHTTVATAYGVGKSTIGDIRTGRVWGWLDQLDPDDPALIRQLLADGMPAYEVAGKFEVPVSAIRRIRGKP